MALSDLNHELIDLIHSQQRVLELNGCDSAKPNLFYEELLQILAKTSWLEVSKQNIAHGLLELLAHVLNHYFICPGSNSKQINNAKAFIKCLLALGESFNHRDELWRTNYLWIANQILVDSQDANEAEGWAMRLIGLASHVPSKKRLGCLIDDIDKTIHSREYACLRNKIEQIGRDVFGFPVDENVLSRTLSSIKRFYMLVENSLNTKECYPIGCLKKREVRSMLKKHGLTHFGEQCSMTLRQGEMVLEQVVSLKKLIQV